VRRVQADALDTLLFTRWTKGLVAGTPLSVRSHNFRKLAADSDDHSVGSGVRIKLTSTYRLGKIIQPSFAIEPKLGA
jgi:hypothetical protein